MKKHKLVVLFYLGLLRFFAKAQDNLHSLSPLLKAAIGVDSNYIQTFTLPNDARIILGGQGAAIGFQSNHDKSLKLDIENYNNVSDLVGFGATYKFIDFDLFTSLNSAVLLPDGSRNLRQFKLSTSYTGRKNSIRGYYSDSKGMISHDPQSDYESSADIHLLKLGVQLTHIFNAKRYSYRAANFQSELQTKTAGSFLFRVEPFYRELGMRSSALISPTRNVTDVFGNQTGLKYVSSIGLLLLPAYGLNMVIRQGKFYTCPMLMLGPGLSYNYYDGQNGVFTTYNIEANGVFVINSGFNGKRMYVNLRASADMCYSYYDPSILSTTEIKIHFTVGFRFRNVENKIPVSLL